MDNAAVTDLLVPLVISCVHAPWKRLNAVILSLLPNEQVLKHLLQTHKFEFPVALLDAFKAKGPPNISFFEDLPDAHVRLWGVYALLLKKDGEKPMLYIGSGTAARVGLKSRMACYTRGASLPRYVSRAMDNGYEVTYRGILVSSPIPEPKDYALVRVVILALESLFTFSFWSLYSKKDYDCASSLAHWPLDTYEYGGLSSHSPLIEGVDGILNLTEQEQKEMLEKVEAARKLGAKRSFAKYYRKIKESGQIKARLARVRESKKFYCDVCEIGCGSPSGLRDHLSGKHHQARLRLPSKRCQVCNVDTLTYTKYKRHHASKRHIAKLSL